VPENTEEERKNPPGKLLTEPGGTLQAEEETKAAYYWTLDTLAESAPERWASR